MDGSVDAGSRQISKESRNVGSKSKAHTNQVDTPKNSTAFMGGGRSSVSAYNIDAPSNARMSTVQPPKPVTMSNPDVMHQKSVAPGADATFWKDVDEEYDIHEGTDASTMRTNTKETENS